MREFIRIGIHDEENTSGYLMADGWRKIGETGGGYNLARLFNINTHEAASVCVYDYDDPRNEDDFWRNISSDEDARIAYNKLHGIITVGLRAKVVKGRKVPIGYTGVVAKFRDAYDKYRRWVATYVVFEDGTSTNVDNCELVLDD